MPGSKQRCWAIRVGVGSHTLALGSRHRGWLYTLAFGSTRRCRFVDAGVGSVLRGLFPLGYARQGLQERERGWRMGAGWGIVDGGGCEQSGSDV